MASATLIFNAGAILVVVLVLIIAHKMLGAHLMDFLSALLREFRHLVDGDINTGAINALGLFLVAAFGVLVVIENVTGHFIHFAQEVLGVQKGSEYAESVSPSTVFIVLVMLAALSVLLTFIRERYP